MLATAFTSSEDFRCAKMTTVMRKRTENKMRISCVHTSYKHRVNKSITSDSLKIIALRVGQLYRNLLMLRLVAVTQPCARQVYVKEIITV